MSDSNYTVRASFALGTAIRIGGGKHRSLANNDDAPRAISKALRMLQGLAGDHREGPFRLGEGRGREADAPAAGFVVIVARLPALLLPPPRRVGEPPRGLSQRLLDLRGDGVDRATTGDFLLLFDEAASPAGRHRRSACEPREARGRSSVRPLRASGVRGCVGSNDVADGGHDYGSFRSFWRLVEHGGRLWRGQVDREILRLRTRGR